MPRRLHRQAVVASWPLAVTALFMAGPAALAAMPVRPGRAQRAPASPPIASRSSVCSKNAAGDLANCPGPAQGTRLPPGQRDGRILHSRPADLAALTDTRTWTSGGGNTFPGADVPFGMVQWSPDTAPYRSDGGGYTYGDRHLIGYSLTHVSGPGCAAAGDVPILPMTGRLPAGDPRSVTTAFDDYHEVAQAGYYSAHSNPPRTIVSQFTATPHAAIGRFTFPRTSAADFLIKLDDSERRDFAATARIIGRDEIAGSVTSGDFCDETSSYGPQRYTVFFDITFGRAFRAARVIRARRHFGPHAVFVTFSTATDRVIEARVAISYVSVRNARLNREREIPGWDFGYYKAKAQRTWNSLLGEIRVSGGSYSSTQEFYSLLYKDFLEPAVISDVNGQYPGSDLRVHHLRKGQANQYGMFSGWDIYHSLAQLQAMLDPRAASDMAQSLVNYYSQNGILPQWGYLNLDNYEMIGDPADSVIADYYAFGARHFQVRTALADMLHQATTVNTIRPGEAAVTTLGYLPHDVRFGCCRLHDYVSALLEYDTADFALSRYAAALGDRRIAARFMRRADNWTHLFDSSDQLLVARFASGAFLSGVKPLTSPNYCEGDAEEYLWDVPNDYAGLFARLGGDARVRTELSGYLSRPAGRGKYANVTNEFDLGEQFAPDYAGDPAETQLVVSDIRNSVYRPGPFGLANNDDLGAESSQFIWEMLGMYPENPGSGVLVFASPGFPRSVIRLPSGKTITISAPGASRRRFYVRSLTINGSADSQLYVTVASLAAGATLDWTLSASPTTWASAPADAPPSY